jgi:hypothetical protein
MGRRGDDLSTHGAEDLEGLLGGARPGETSESNGDEARCEGEVGSLTSTNGLLGAGNGVGPNCATPGLHQVGELGLESAKARNP